MSRGILYFAKGEEYPREAKISAAQINSVMPDTSIAVVTNKKTDTNLFDSILIDDTEFSKSDKPRALLRSPFDRTIYLDSDIYVTESIDEIFAHLDRFDLVLSRDQYEYNINPPHPVDGVPEGFPELNTGVLVFNQTDSVLQLLRDWKNRCRPEANRDQKSFRPALFYSEVRYSILPQRYNCIYRFQNHVNGKVKILHGSLVDREGSLLGDHGVSIEDVSENINNRENSRVMYNYHGKIFIHPPPPPVSRALTLVRNEGLGGTIKKLIGYIVND